MTSKLGLAFSEKRKRLRKIAEQTLNVLETGLYSLPSSNIPRTLTTRIVSLKTGTRYYGPDSFLSTWSSSASTQTVTASAPEISILEISTIDGVRFLATNGSTGTIGLLNFASAKKPGGGFINGAQAQEESLARSSTLYASLMTSTGQQFYALHKRDQKGGYYTHAMIYSPGVVFFRDDEGGWTEPLEADVLTSAAVNAGVARDTLHGRVAGKGEEARIETAMRERMARVLFLFQKKNVKNLVLGSFGTGVFK